MGKSHQSTKDPATRSSENIKKIKGTERGKLLAIGPDCKENDRQTDEVM